MRADVLGLLLVSGDVFGGLKFDVRTAPTFVERLHPEGFGDMGDGFREPVKSGGTGIKSRAGGLPPGVE